jgi:hypothetical protein
MGGCSAHGESGVGSLTRMYLLCFVVSTAVYTSGGRPHTSQRGFHPPSPASFALEAGLLTRASGRRSESGAIPGGLWTCSPTLLLGRWLHPVVWRAHAMRFL